MKTVYRFCFYTFLQHEKQTEYLSNLHKKGLKLICYIFPFFYIFQECTPEDVIYQIDFNEVDTSSKEEYIKLFEDSCWEYIQTSFNFSFFRKSLSTMEGEEHIFNDDQSIKDMKLRFKTSKTFKKLMLYIVTFILFGIIIITSQPWLVLTSYVMIIGGIIFILIRHPWEKNNSTNV